MSQHSNSNNMYRVGDYVYFENSSASSYAIRRIEELNRTSNGNVEARVMCFYRRSEIPPSVLAQSDKVHWAESEAALSNGDLDSDDEDAIAERTELQNMRLREVFLSRQVETLPATLIRGKCSVTLLSEVETPSSYLTRDDAFFYSLVFDPHQKTLQADRGEIRIGVQYQAQVINSPGDEDPDDRGDGVKDRSGIVFPDLEERCWVPSGQEVKAKSLNQLTTADIDKFLIVARSVGTFARALDCSSSVKQPSLHMSAAAASRDVTLFHAYDLLHKHNYDVAEALKALVPPTGPMLCRDEMEDWSASEANLFEEAIEKYGKGFNDIRKDFLPWKSMKSIIEYFFMWKTTDRYIQQKRIKAMEAESKLKQVFVPSYTNKTTRLTGASGEIIIRGKDCDAYPNLTKYSWVHYKKYGKFVPATVIDDSFILDKSPLTSAAQRLAQLRPGLIIEPGSPSANPKAGAGKTRAAFYLRTTPMTRAARQLCRSSVRLSHHARCPGKLIDLKAIKAETYTHAAKLDPRKIILFNSFSRRKRCNMNVVVKRLGMKDLAKQDWLVLTPKHKMPKPTVEFFPRPPKRPDGSYIYDRIPPSTQAIRSVLSSGIPSDRYTGPQSQLFKKRQYEEKPPTSTDVPAKLIRTGNTPGPMGDAPVRSGPVQVFPKGRVATLTRIHGGQRHVISWMDAPDDVFFKASPTTKKLRKKLPTIQLRRAARKPFKTVISLPQQVLPIPEKSSIPLI